MIQNGKKILPKAKLAAMIAALLALVIARKAIFRIGAKPAPAISANISASPDSINTANTAMPPSNQQQQSQLEINSTPTGYLNVRSQPSLLGQIITQVSPGQTFAYSQTKSGWYEIELPNEQSGWIDGTYASIKN